MTPPKKAYRDKVRGRLESTKALFADKEQLMQVLLRMGFAKNRSELGNKIEWFYMLLEKDIPALLAAFDEATDADNTK